MKLKSFLLGLCFLLLAGGVFAQYRKVAVLVYTSPDFYHNPSVPAAVTELKEMAEKNFMDFHWTQLESTFNDSILKRYSVVVFLHSTDGKFNADQQESLKRFVRNGNGFVGIHASTTGGGSDWFKKLVGRSFTRHPEKQTGVMSVVDKNFPAAFHLPDKWIWTDEWYEFGEALTKNQHVILTVDESSYVVDVGMGSYHPIAWYQEFDGGRSFYTALGHLPEAYSDKLFLDHILGGIYWAATGKGIRK